MGHAKRFYLHFVNGGCNARLNRWKNLGGDTCLKVFTNGGCRVGVVVGRLNGWKKWVGT